MSPLTQAASSGSGVVSIAGRNWTRTGAACYGWFGCTALKDSERINQEELCTLNKTRLLAGVPSQSIPAGWCVHTLKASLKRSVPSLHSQTLETY
ncbi:hypothetical protein AOLI_G00270860 [Acnodon oligacanthus]